MSATDHTSDIASENWRMNAYYYGFDRTGQVAIDRILSAVAHAGKGYHHTEFWTDPLDYGAPSHLRGDSYVECIQNAAIDAADTLRTAEARAAAAEVASRGYRERAEKAERERDAALRTVDEHRCDGQAERAYKRAIHAEAERDALAERAEAAEAKSARFAGLLAHQSRTLTGTIAAEVLRQKADAWDEGYTSGHSRAMRRMSDEPNVEPGTNPYRAALTPPTTTEETTHE